MLRGEALGLHAGAQLLALRRQTQDTRPPVRAVDAAIDQAEALHLIHQLAHAGAFEPEPRGEPVLIDVRVAGLLAERDERSQVLWLDPLAAIASDAASATIWKKRRASATGVRRSRTPPLMKVEMPAAFGRAARDDFREGVLCSGILFIDKLYGTKLFSTILIIRQAPFRGGLHRLLTIILLIIFLTASLAHRRTR